MRLAHLEVNEDAGDTINAVLGIAPERSLKIRKIVTASVIGSDTATEAMALIAEKCENNNELAFAMFSLGQFTSIMREADRRVSEHVRSSSSSQSSSGNSGNNSGSDIFARSLAKYMGQGRS